MIPETLVFARSSFATCASAHLEQVEALVRARYGVAEDQIVLVSEEVGRMPGLPDRMTTILFWTGPEARHRVRVFKAAREVTDADLPPRWVRAALRDEGVADCC